MTPLDSVIDGPMARAGATPLWRTPDDLHPLLSHLVAPPPQPVAHGCPRKTCFGTRAHVPRAAQSGSAPARVRSACRPHRFCLASPWLPVPAAGRHAKRVSRPHTTGVLRALVRLRRTYIFRPAVERACLPAKPLAPRRAGHVFARTPYDSAGSTIYLLAEPRRNATVTLRTHVYCPALCVKPEEPTPEDVAPTSYGGRSLARYITVEDVTSFLHSSVHSSS